MIGRLVRWSVPDRIAPTIWDTLNVIDEWCKAILWWQGDIIRRADEMLERLKGNDRTT